MSLSPLGKLCRLRTVVKLLWACSPYMWRAPNDVVRSMRMICCCILHCSWAELIALNACEVLSSKSFMTPVIELCTATAVISISALSSFCFRITAYSSSRGILPILLLILLCRLKPLLSPLNGSIACSLVCSELGADVSLTVSSEVSASEEQNTSFKASSSGCSFGHVRDESCVLRCGDTLRLFSSFHTFDGTGLHPFLYGPSLIQEVLSIRRRSSWSRSLLRYSS